MLNKEARKWSAKVVRDMRTVRSTMKQINMLMDQIKAAKVLPDSIFMNLPYADTQVCMYCNYGAVKLTIPCALNREDRL